MQSHQSGLIVTRLAYEWKEPDSIPAGVRGQSPTSVQALVNWGLPSPSFRPSNLLNHLNTGQGSELKTVGPAKLTETKLPHHLIESLDTFPNWL